MCTAINLVGVGTRRYGDRGEPRVADTWDRHVRRLSVAAFRSPPALPGDGAAMNQTESNFLKNTAASAMATMRSSGVPASITLAQAIDESGWGLSGPGAEGQQFLWHQGCARVAPDAYIQFTTDEFVDGRKTSVMASFARYVSPQECFIAHAQPTEPCAALRARPWPCATIPPSSRPLFKPAATPPTPTTPAP